MYNTSMGKEHILPAPTGAFPFPELHFSREELHFD
jgi:hypothetical protein